MLNKILYYRSPPSVTYIAPKQDSEGRLLSVHNSTSKPPRLDVIPFKLTNPNRTDPIYAMKSHSKGAKMVKAIIKTLISKVNKK